MVTLDSWLQAGTTVPNAEHRATLAWRRIQQKPTSIVLRPDGGAARASQTFRIEYNNSSTFREGETVRRGIHAVTLFGIRDHPTLTNSVIEKGDRFLYQKAEFEVKSVIYTLGEVQALCEANT